MALIKCPHCQKDISSIVTVCPYCSADVSQAKDSRQMEKTYYDPEQLASAQPELHYPDSSILTEHSRRMKQEDSYARNRNPYAERSGSSYRNSYSYEDMDSRTQTGTADPYQNFYSRQQTGTADPYQNSYSRQQTGATDPYQNSYSRRQTGATDPYQNSYSRRQTGATDPYQNSYSRRQIRDTASQEEQAAAAAPQDTASNAKSTKRKKLVPPGRRLLGYRSGNFFHMLFSICYYMAAAVGILYSLSLYPHYQEQGVLIYYLCCIFLAGLMLFLPAFLFSNTKMRHSLPFFRSRKKNTVLLGTALLYLPLLILFFLAGLACV